MLPMFVMSACIAQPTGLEQTWPPKLGLSIDAVVAGDLDGDGRPEVLVLSSGTDHVAGLYRVEGGVDLALGSPDPVHSFSAFVPLSVTHPGALAIDSSGSTPIVFTAYADDFGAIVVQPLSNQLALGDYFDSGLTAGNTLLWVRPLAFPSNETQIVIGTGTEIDYATVDGLDVTAVTPPNASTWSTAVLAMTYPGGAAMVVATPTELWRAPLPGSTFTRIRNGPAWIGQTAIDLDGNGREEIVGLDLIAQQLCAFDVEVGVPQCSPLVFTASGTEASIAVARVAGTAAPDLVVALSSASQTSTAVFADFAFSSGGLTGLATVMPTVSTGHGKLVVANAGAGTPDAALVFGGDGAVVCVAGGC